MTFNFIFFVQDNLNSYVATVDVPGTESSSPAFTLFTVSGGQREIVLSKGLWVLELSSASQTLLVVGFSSVIF